MKKVISASVLVFSCFVLTGCVSKMIGGAVSVATFGIVKDDTIKEHNNKIEKHITDKEVVEKNS